MTPRRDRWLLWCAGLAVVVLGLQYTPTGQQLTSRIVYLYDATANAPISTSLEGSIRGVAALLVDPNTNAYVQYTTDPTHDSTVGTQGPQQMLVGTAAAPTNVTDGRAVRQWGLQSGAAVIQPSYAGTLASTGVGASGAGVPRSVDVASGTTGAAPPAQASYIAGITSGATGGFLSAGITVCDSQGYLDMTTATTTEIAPLVASRTIHVCNILAMANGATTITLKRGTGTNCGTGTASVSPAIELTAQTGWVEGTGVGDILGSAGAGTVGGAMTSGNALCVTSSAAVNLHVKVRYAVY